MIKITDGRKLLDKIASHHYLLMMGHNLADIKMLSGVFDLQIIES